MPDNRNNPIVKAGEWRWVIIASVLVMAFTSLPVLVGMANHTPGRVFSGFTFSLVDTYSYIAKMRSGAQGDWLFQLVYTVEPHARRLIYEHYILLGKLAVLFSGRERVTTEALVLTFHIARIVCGIGLLVVVYRFVAEFLETVPQRRLAWVVASLSGGLGWIRLFLAPDGGLADLDYPLEFYLPEAFTILLLYAIPHLALARGLMLTGWLALFRATDKDNWRVAAGASLAWAVMGMIVPLYIGVLGVLIAVWLGLLWVSQRRLPGQTFRLAAIAGALPVVVLLYNGWVFTADPVYAAWAAQNFIPSPAPINVLLAYGLLAALSIPAVISLIRDGLTRRSALLVVWPVVAVVLMYLPTNTQRRLLEGIILPLSILSVLGAAAIYRRSESRQRLRWLMLAGAYVLLLPSTVMIIGGGSVVAADSESLAYHSADEVAALDWLRDQAEVNSIVLSTQKSGEILPTYASVRVYVGHGVETVDGETKRAVAEDFFSDGMTDEERIRFLDEVPIDYVWVGPAERELACSTENCLDPERLGLRVVFSQGDYTIHHRETER